MASVRRDPLGIGVGIGIGLERAHMSFRHERLDVYRATIGSIGVAMWSAQNRPTLQHDLRKSIPMPIAIPTPWGEAELNECAATTARLGPNRAMHLTRKEMRAAEGRRSA